MQTPAIHSPAILKRCSQRYFVLEELKVVQIRLEPSDCILCMRYLYQPLSHGHPNAVDEAWY